MRALRIGIVSRAAPERALGGPRGPRLSLIMVLFSPEDAKFPRFMLVEGLG